MSRRSKLITALIVVAAAAGATGGGLAYATGGHGTPEYSATHHGATPTVASRVPLKDKPMARFPAPGVPHWRILESGPAARSFVISVDQFQTSAGCPAGATVTTTETATMILVHIRDRYVRAQACTADYHPALVKVVLHGPINGRAVKGAGLTWPTGGVLYLTADTRGGIVVDRVPQVVGFAVDQAIQVLRAQQFKGERVGGSGTTVIAQSPGRGQLATDLDPSHQFFGTVRLTTRA